MAVFYMILAMQHAPFMIAVGRTVRVDGWLCGRLPIASPSLRLTQPRDSSWFVFSPR